MLNTTQKVVTLNPDMTSAAVQGIPQFMGISGKSAGSTGIAMNITAFGPGGKAKVHYHSGFETAIYGLVGTTVLYWGEQLENMCRIDPGVFCFIPPTLRTSHSICRTPSRHMPCRVGMIRWNRRTSCLYPS